MGQNLLHKTPIELDQPFRPQEILFVVDQLAGVHHQTVRLDVVRYDGLENHEIDQIEECDERDRVHWACYGEVDLEQALADQLGPFKQIRNRHHGH